MIGLGVGGRQRLNAGLTARDRAAVGVFRAEDIGRQHPTGDGARVAVRLLDARHLLGLGPLEVLGPEGRVLDDVGIESQRRLQPRLDRVQRDVGVVDRRTRADGRAQQLLLVADLQGRQPVGAVGHDGGGQLGHAVLAHRISGRAGLDDQVHADGRHAGARGQHHLQPVRQGEALKAGEVGLRRRARIGHPGAIGARRRRGEVRERQDFQRIAAVGQPVATGPRQVGGRGGQQTLVAGLPGARVAEEDLAFGQTVGLAAEAADALQAANER
ncbi:hypothetical protein D3C72_1204860 [compost metagenome]